jgi:hypothetical protein
MHNVEISLLLATMMVKFSKIFHSIFSQFNMHDRQAKFSYWLMIFTTWLPFSKLWKQDEM